MIGDPNGVEVKLEHLSFLAWVTEQYQGTPTRPILNANELDKTYLTDEPIYPMINSIKQALEASCGMTKRFMVRMSNIGTNTLNSLKFRAEVGNETHEFEWQGQLASGDYANIDFEMDIPVGTFNGTIRITEANGSAYQDSWNFAAENLEYTEVNVENSTVTLKLYIIQDVYGEQTTWDIINSAGEVVAQGGPYQHLAGSSGTQPNVETINNVPANECYLFRIFDSGKNGICCNYGEGHYYMKLSGGEKIFEGEGDFGAMASQEFSIKCQSGVVETEPSAFKIYPNPANNELYISSEAGSFEYQIVNGLGQVVMSGKADGVATVDVSELSGVYFVRFVGETTSVKKIIVR